MSKRPSLEQLGIVLPPSAKVLGIAAVGAEVGPNRVVADFDVPGRPVPWKAPIVPRSGRPYKDKSLVAWQETVRLHARLAMAGREAFGGPVEVYFRFTLSPRPGSPPDLSNLVKASEDALQEIVIVNDTQVGKIVSRKVKGAVDGVRIVVRAFTGEDT